MKTYVPFEPAGSVALIADGPFGLVVAFAFEGACGGLFLSEKGHRNK